MATAKYQRKRLKALRKQKWFKEREKEYYRKYKIAYFKKFPEKKKERAKKARDKYRKKVLEQTGRTVKYYRPREK